MILGSNRATWDERYRSGKDVPRSVNVNLMQHAAQLKPGRLLDLAGGLGQNAQWVAEHVPGAWRVVIADFAIEALRRAPPHLARVLCDAAALPFVPFVFDTILCVRFYDRRIQFAHWLAPGGTVFFETYSTADVKYRPDFNPAHRFDFADLAYVFAGLEVLIQQETDDGHRAYATILARKGTAP